MAFLMMGFGLMMGVIFPIYAHFFVNFKPGLRPFFIAGCLVAGGVVGVANYFIFKRTVGKTLVMLRGAFNELSNGDGDLTVRLASGGADEIGEIRNAFNHFMDQLQNALDGVEGARKQLSDAVGQLSSQLGTLTVISKNVRGAAVALDEHSATVRDKSGDVARVLGGVEERFGQMSGVIDSLADTVRQVTDETRASNDRVRLFGKAADEARGLVDEVAHTVDGVKGGAQVVFEVVSLLQEISTKTRMLSVNASIEAAAAGESGRGFGVVAKEVRTLASKTQIVSERISVQLEDMVRQIGGLGNQFGLLTERFDEMAGLNRGLVGQLGEQVVRSDEMIGRTDDMTTQVDHLRSALSTGCHALEEVAGDETQALDEGVSRTRSGVERLDETIGQTVSATAQLERTSKDLKKLMENFGDRHRER